MTSGLPISHEMAMAMAPLLDRGRASFAAYLEALPSASRPIGGATMRIVCEEDFVANVALIMRFIHQARATVYVLDADNDLALMTAPFTWRR